MSLFKAIVKRTATVNGIHLEKGMSVEVSSRYVGNPMFINSGQEVADAFMRVHGIDLKKANALSSSYIDMEKIG